MTEKHHCDKCCCEVDASDKLNDGSYRCDECFTFFAELNWNDPDDRAERIEAYLERREREDMNTEQERAAFDAWCESIGLCVTGKYAETIAVLCAESAFKAGYQAGRAAKAALQSQPQETIAYVTRNEEGDPVMLFFDLQEARLYCEPGEEPEPLVLSRGEHNE